MPSPSRWRVTTRALQDWWDDHCPRLAASLACYPALSPAPLVLLRVDLPGLVIARQQVASQRAAQLERLRGPAGWELVTSILTTTPPQGGTWATVVGLGTLLLGATAGDAGLGAVITPAPVTAWHPSRSPQMTMIPIYVANLLSFPGAWRVECSPPISALRR